MANQERRHAKTELRLLLLFASPLAVLTVLTLILMQRGSAATMRLQAEKSAATLANQVLTDRKHYAQSVVAKLTGTEFSAREGYHAGAPFVPLPATFVMGIADDVCSSQDEYRYGLVSRWNVNPASALADEFLREWLLGAARPGGRGQGRRRAVTAEPGLHGLGADQRGRHR